MKKKTKKSGKKNSGKTTPAKTVENKTGVTPLGDRVLIKPILPESVTASGIIIPETVDKEKPEQGIVVAVGPGKLGDDNVIVPVNVHVGNKVMFSKYGYDEVKVAGVEYYIVSEQNILAILK